MNIELEFESEAVKATPATKVIYECHSNDRLADIVLMTFRTRTVLVETFLDRNNVGKPFIGNRTNSFRDILYASRFKLWRTNSVCDEVVVEFLLIISF